MAHRSQLHKAEVHRYRPPLTDVQPRSASIVAAGAVARVIMTLTPVGGVSPYTYALTVPAGLAAAFTGNQLKSTVNPIGTVGVHNATAVVTDYVGQKFTVPLAVTLT